jgi:biopolymer transport protein ExbB
MLPELLAHGGVMMWLLLLAGTVALVVFVERLLHYHREQVNSMDFLNGLPNVLKRDNVVEAISICDATPGPVARLARVSSQIGQRFTRCRSGSHNTVGLLSPA